MRTSAPALIEAARWLALASVIGMAPAVLPRPTAGQEQVTVSGEVVDLACYLSKGLKGKRHKACAEMCAKKGLPLGVLTEAGDVYLLIEDHDNPGPYDTVKGLAGEQAEVSGKKFTKGGVQSILISSVKGQ
jgi:hypothetical protein